MSGDGATYAGGRATHRAYGEVTNPALEASVLMGDSRLRGGGGRQ